MLPQDIYTSWGKVMIVLREYWNFKNQVTYQVS